MDGGAWWSAVHGVAKSQTQLSDFSFTFHFHALEKEMATHSSVLAWRIPGTGEPGGLPSMGSHRVGHDWSDLAAAAAGSNWLTLSRRYRAAHACGEKAMAPHFSTLAWKISWAEEPGRLQTVGSWRVGHDWATSLSLFTFMHWRRKWQPTPLFLPGESQGQGSLVGCRLWVAQSQTRLKRLSSSSSRHMGAERNRSWHPCDTQGCLWDLCPILRVNS